MTPVDLAAALAAALRAFAEALGAPATAPVVAAPATPLACVACDGPGGPGEICGACVRAAEDAEFFRVTSTERSARSVQVRLNRAGLAETSAAKASLASDDLLWEDAPTAWFVDAKGLNHAREWSGFFRGRVVARVRLNRDGRYAALVWNPAAAEFQMFGGSTRTHQAAMRLAADAVSDRGVAEMICDVAARVAAEKIAEAVTGLRVVED